MQLALLVGVPTVSTTSVTPSVKGPCGARLALEPAVARLPALTCSMGSFKAQHDRRVPALCS